MHWADATAKKIIKKKEKLNIEKYIVGSGITPSGHIHIGNARETLTADGIYKGLLKEGVNAELIFIADNYDPLRKVYPFLPKEYEQYVGMPLSEIPCPEGCCNSYSDHFLNPFLNSLEDLGIDITVYKADENYKNGLYNEAIITALNNKTKIKEILDKYRKEPLSENWYPLNIVCENCGKLSTTTVINYNVENKTVDYVCSNCNYENTVSPLNGRGKLPWRVDWPARWKIFGVTTEPMGKDHGASGGSYDTGIKISQIVYRNPAPEKIIYEWIQLKVGDKALPMSSSSGVVFAVKDWVKICHPEVLRFLLLRSKPTKHIDFNLKTLPNIVDDYDELEEKYFQLIKTEKDGEQLNENDKDKIRLYELCNKNIPEKLPINIPYKFCVVVSQIAYNPETKEIDMDKVLDILQRNNYENIKLLKDENYIYDYNKLKNRLYCAMNWALEYGEKLILIDSETAKKYYNKLSEKQQQWIKSFCEVLKNLSSEKYNSSELHELIYETSKQNGLEPKEAFTASYNILLGKNYGPKLGSFLSSLDKEFVINRYSLE